MTSLAMLFQTNLDPAVDGHRLVSQMLADFPDLNPAQLTVDPPEDPDDPLTLSYGDAMIALMGIDAPIGDDLPQIAEHSRLWPDSVTAPAEYGAHTIVTVLRPGEEITHIEAIEDAALLSRVIAAIVALTDTVVAVYFGSANHVILPALFRDLAVETLPEPLLPAWVAFNVGPRPDGVMTGFTLGLDMLGLMDIEIGESSENAEDTFGRLANIAVYQLENGPVIGDGHTLGATADAEVVAHLAPSVMNPDKTILRLTFGGGVSPAVDQPKKRGLFRRR